MLNRGADASARREVSDRVEFFAAENISHRSIVAKIDMVNDHVFAKAGNVCVLDLRIVKIVEVIEDDDGVSCREQAFNEMGADETCAASDKNSHAPRSSTTKHTECTKKIIFG